MPLNSLLWSMYRLRQRMALCSRTGKKRLPVNQARVTMRSSARGLGRPARLLREDFLERVLCLVLGHL
jgi:hypothetical protein